MPHPPLVDHVLELLSATGAARARRMFGGHGVYVDDLFVGIVAAERLYLKADESGRARFEAAGCEPFAFDTRGGRRTVLGFWSAPPEALESPALMQPWARLALQAALAARAAPVRRRAAPAARRASVGPRR